VTADDDAAPEDDASGPAPLGEDGYEVFGAVRQVLTGEPELPLTEVAHEAGIPVRILEQVFEAADWHDRPAYDQRDVEYARDIARMLDVFPLDTVVRSLSTRYRALSSIVVSDLGLIRDEVVMPALATGETPEGIGDTLGRAAESILPLVTRNLSEDYRHILLGLLDSDALARGVEGGREIDLAVGFVDVAGYTALSGRVDPAGLDHVLSGFEDLVNRAVTRHDDVLVAKFMGDAAMLIASDPLLLASVLLELVHDDTHMAEAPRKAGIAHGPVLVRQGDYYGPTANLAARLTDHARPWSLLAAEDMEEVLDERFEVTTTPETKLRGVGEHRPLRIRPREDG
jgi:adenylate cyclase